MRFSRHIRIGVVGLGYWGPNLARNFDALDGCELAWCCDSSPALLERHAPRFTSARFTEDLADLLEDPRLDAVALATPVPTHDHLARVVLEAGKHCFVEKPLAQSVADAERAVAAARAAGRVLMVGHLLEYHPGVVKLKELADSGELGAITRSGDIWSPRLSNAEPLRAECGHFVDCIREGRAPVSGAESGLRVVRVLERLQRALDDTRRSSATASIAAP